MKIFFVCCALTLFLLPHAFSMPRGEEESRTAAVGMLARRSPEGSASVATPRQVPRPLSDSIQIPESARGYEEIYRKFVGGTLTYKPRRDSDEGRIDLPIRALANPLEAEFDLSRCGDRGKFLSINTGYRKDIRPENARKFEVWIAPYFLIKRNLRTWLLFPGAAAHLNPVMQGWVPSKAPVGLFYAWGGGDDVRDYDYVTSNSLTQLSDKNLYEKWSQALGHSSFIPPQALALCPKLETFHLSFED